MRRLITCSSGENGCIRVQRVVESIRVRFRLATLVTWLILPVVICLSQRLSHACLSISLNTVKLRTAHYISYSLFDGFFLQG